MPGKPQKLLAGSSLIWFEWFDACLGRAGQGKFYMLPIKKWQRRKLQNKFRNFIAILEMIYYWDWVNVAFIYVYIWYLFLCALALFKYMSFIYTRSSRRWGSGQIFALLLISLEYLASCIHNFAKNLLIFFGYDLLIILLCLNWFCIPILSI